MIVWDSFMGVDPSQFLPSKQPVGVGEWSRHGKKFKLAAEIPLTLSTWLKATYQESILNLCKNEK